MAASPISSGASFVFPTSAVESSTSVSVGSYVGSEEIDASTCRNINEMISCIRGGDHKAAASQWHMAQREIDVMVQEIHSNARTQHTLAKSYALRLLAFADEITNLQLSPDKLFVVVRLHKVLNPDFFVELQWHPESEEFSMAKYSLTLQKLRAAVYHMLHELKVLIQTRGSRSVPSGGGIHEVTRVAQAYDSAGLQCFFLMNNLHFAVKQVEGSELISLLGHSWVQVHRDFIEQYMETYVDLTWGPVLSCLSNTRTGMLGGCFSRPSSTARFCLQFDATYYNQECWKVEDPRLREIVRRAVNNQIISAYRAHFEKYGKVQRRYEWYTPELLEAQLMQLFEGRTG